MSREKNLRIYFVAGEESGDVLGSDLIASFERLSIAVEPVGLGGSHMKERGLTSLFDISELSVNGLSGVIPRLPNLLRRIRQTAEDVVLKRPDVLLLIDSPEFSYRVAKKVRKQLPELTIIKYVCPSVWAWRPGRAARIAGYIDHILAILPFEPAVLKELDGPEATYIGHPLAATVPAIDGKSKRQCHDLLRLVVLPGSRKSETRRLMPVISRTLDILAERGNRFEVTLPTLEKLEAEITAQSANWPNKPKIVTGDAARQAAFKQADIALAASGTVTLELALYKVPMISIYKLDAIAFTFRRLLTGWTASLPNLIADYPVVPERLNEYAHPQYIARMIERLAVNGPERRLQLDGFEVVAKRLKQKQPSGLLAARKIVEVLKDRNQRMV